MSEQTYKELPPVPEGTGWAEVLEAAEKKLNAARATIAELEKRIGELESAWDQLTKRHAEALTDLAAERQRIRELTADLHEWWSKANDFENDLDAHTRTGDKPRPPLLSGSGEVALPATERGTPST